MAKLKKALEIIALPLVLVVGHALTATVLLLVAVVGATGLGWLIALNIESPSAFIVVLDFVTLVGLILSARSPRVRKATAETWKQIVGNF